MKTTPSDNVDTTDVPTCRKVCQKSISKGPWTAEEDSLLSKMVKAHGTKDWTEVASALTTRTGKQCRERWYNHLNPAIKKVGWSASEDQDLIRLQAELGNKWSQIAKSLPGRSENQVKNRWNSLLRSHWNRNKKSQLTDDLENSIPVENGSSVVQGSAKIIGLESSRDASDGLASPAPLTPKSGSSSLSSSSSSSSSSSNSRSPLQPCISPLASLQEISESLSTIISCDAVGQKINDETIIRVPRKYFAFLLQEFFSCLSTSQQERAKVSLKNNGEDLQALMEVDCAVLKEQARPKSAMSNQTEEEGRRMFEGVRSSLYMETASVSASSASSPSFAPDFQYRYSARIGSLSEFSTDTLFDLSEPDAECS